MRIFFGSVDALPGGTDAVGAAAGEDGEAKGVAAGGTGVFGTGATGFAMPDDSTTRGGGVAFLRSTGCSSRDTTRSVWFFSPTRS